jgi:hypothetical protein
LNGRSFADIEEGESEVRKPLRQQSKDFYAAGFDTLVMSWEVEVCRKYFFFQFRISHVLRFISIYDLFTDFPSYIVSMLDIKSAQMRLLASLVCPSEVTLGPLNALTCMWGKFC